MATLPITNRPREKTVKDVLGPVLLEFLQQRARYARCSWEKYLVELVEKSRQRSANYTHHEALPGQRSRLTYTEKQRVIFLHFDCDLNVETIAERFNVGASTIQRIISKYKTAKHVPVPTGSGSNAGRGQEIRFGKGL
jgi:hypothetical protein